MKKIGIIGGGASGLAAAVTAARQKDTEVFILEHKEQAGKKLLSTGNGRCNLTNERMDGSFFRSCEPDCIEAVLKQFGYEDTVHFFEGLGLMLRSRNGYIYPRCEQASVVRELLVREAKRLGVRIYTDVHVTEILPGRKGFKISGGRETFYADRVILSCGGRAAKVLGSDGSGYALAKSLGHSLVPVVPALVQLKVKDNPLKAAAGVRTEALVSAYVDGKCAASDTGELQITDYGISGIPVFQVSRYMAMALYQKKKAEIVLDFLPSMAEEEFLEYLMKRRSGREDMKTSEFLAGIFNNKLTSCLPLPAEISVKRRVGELEREEQRRFVRQCKHMVLPIQDTNGFDNAQVCAGGVSLREIDRNTMESCYVEGLYLAGELLDADGMCGGYNLQWAWATGVLAGRAAGRQ
ncbi:MAG: aminoacetone oxidase family FAD-binding enzyme [Lachnospiraceae bacterium]